MAEYIKKALVAQEIRKLLRVRESPVDIFQAGFEFGVNLAWVKIDKIPAADVAQVVHGHWIRQDESFTRFKCSNPKCGIENCNGFENYCPNCGAKMNEGKGDFIE